MSLFKSHPFSWELFAKVPIVGIIRGLGVEDVRQILPIYQQAGLTTIEITMNTPGAAQMIDEALTDFSGQINIGAGTVRTMADLDSALAAGAQFVVTPTLNEAVVRACVERGVPVFPGALTPTEIEVAWLLGASMVKVYPANVFGPGYIRDVKAPMNDVKLLPTGGVDIDNIAAFFNAGADGVGMGSQLIDKKLVQQRDWKTLGQHFESILTVYQQRF